MTYTNVKETCSDYYNCCDCGNRDGGSQCCMYCWSCNACENCINNCDNDTDLECLY